MKINLHDADDAAGKTRTGVSGCRGKGYAAFAKIVDVRMNYDRTSDYTVDAGERNYFIGYVDGCHSLGVGFYVSKIADVSLHRFGSSVRFLEDGKRFVLTILFEKK